MYTNIVAAPVTQSKLFICIGVHLCLIGQSSSLVNSSEAHMYICSVTVLQRQRSYDALLYKCVVGAAEKTTKDESVHPHSKILRQHTLLSFLQMHFRN